MKRRLLIVWWSATGGSWQLARAAARGARSERAIETLMRRCDRVDAPLLLSADALLIACPEMLGGAAGMMKDFFDRTYYAALGRLAGRPYALIVCAGSDGQGAIRQIERIMQGWRLRLSGEPLRVVVGAQTPEAIAAPKSIDPAALVQARELGAGLAAGLALGLW
jgi:multimeric flavodoxin WrbA